MKRALLLIAIFGIIGLAAFQINNPSGGSGTVTAVSGTANQIDVATGTTTPVLTISSTLVAPGTATITGNLTANGTTNSFPNGAISVGSAGAAATACPPGSVTGAICLVEASTAGTPTATVDYIRADSTSHTLKYSVNGGAEATLPSSGGAVFTAFCASTVGTGNGTTYILSPFLSTATSNQCNGTAVVEMLMPVACTAQHLAVSAGVGGSASGSGVVTLFKNGGASALTCTLGIGAGSTTCRDDTHTVSINGTTDTYSVRVTTGQASDTTSGVKVTFQCI